MRFAKTGKRFSIFGKLVLAFLVVMTPLFALGIYISDKGAQIVDKEISQSLQQQLQFYLMSLETEFERMTALQREFMNDEDLDGLSMMEGRMSTYERLSAIKRLQARLRLIKESSLYIAVARAYIPSVARTVSSDGDVRELDPIRLDELKDDTLRMSQPFIASNDGLYIREYYPSPYNLNVRNPNFVLELQLSIPALYRFLEQLPGYENGGAALLNGDVVVVSDKHAEAFGRIKGELDRELSLWLETGMENGSSAAARTTSISLQDGNYLTTHLYSPVLNCYLIVYVPEKEVMGPLNNYRTYMWLIFGIALLVIPVFAYWIYRIIHRPLRKLVGAFRKVESGILQVEIRHKSNDEFHYLYEKFNFMVAHLNTLIYEVYEQKIHLQQSELKQLQSQINPHFLYNSFYLLYRMTKAYDIDNAIRFTRFLGDYYQYITRNAKEEVDLEDELQHVRSYTEIQSIRFGERIRVELEEPPANIKDIQVPRLILQPIVENAYQHAFNYDVDDCLLQIGYSLEQSSSGEGMVSIIVKDNGGGMEADQLELWRRRFSHDQHDTEVTGMLNVHRRLRLKYGESAGVQVYGEEKGLSVVIRIPLPLTADPERDDRTVEGGM